MEIREIMFIASRGSVMVVDYVDGDYWFGIGDRVYYDNAAWRVTGIEMSRRLTDSPTISPSVGLLVVKEVN